MVTREDIRDVVVTSIRTVLDNAVPEGEISISASLRDLGANSIDRAEIMTQVMAALNLKMSMVELAQARTIAELTEVFYEKQRQAWGQR